MDYFVGIVAIFCGTLLLLGGLTGARWLMTLAKVRLLADGIGSASTRGLCALIGLGLIILGILVASGWRPRWAGSQDVRSSSSTSLSNARKNGSTSVTRPTV